LACNTPSIIGLAIPPEDMQRFDQPEFEDDRYTILEVSVGKKSE
jgi:hypothetical protein